MLMARLVIDLILQCSTVKGACAITGISWDEAWGIMHRPVARGEARKEARPIAYIGVDAYYATLTDAQKAALKAVAMDMWEPYIRRDAQGLARRRHKIVFDRFHIMRDITKAVDTVRKQEHRPFLRDGWRLAADWHEVPWLFSEERRPERHEEAFATLQALNLKVGRAWAIKEALRTPWTSASLRR